MPCIPPNPKRVGYIDPIHEPLDEPLYMGSHIHQYPPSLNYRHSGVQDWTTRKPTPPPAAVGTTVAAVFKTVQEESTNDKYPPQAQLATCYIEAGAKLREGQEGQSLGEDISKLGGSRDMEYPNIADGDSVAHEV